jgi:hypothetical protein
LPFLFEEIDALKRQLNPEKTASTAASFLWHIPYPHSSKQMTLILTPRVHLLVNLMQLKLDHACDIFTPRVQPQETYVFFFGIVCR